ncbi:alpha/beta-hydrolases superfamily protein [Anaeramoeba flamelloides]|uniref:Alpha/beta-hydrolases superfamily protein n=1 Tax=Anaeramoeba flamelloides TaxID=1746091 RepID=A0ABQ8XAA2_9EUKA|nr:alpha/beta-hydrolases superfamily protein [Anaeramoeba flamelloides]
MNKKQRSIKPNAQTSNTFFSYFFFTANVLFGFAILIFGWVNIFQHFITYSFFYFHLSNIKHEEINDSVKLVPSMTLGLLGAFWMFPITFIYILDLFNLSKLPNSSQLTTWKTPIWNLNERNPEQSTDFEDFSDFTTSSLSDFDSNDDLIRNQNSNKNREKSAKQGTKGNRNDDKSHRNVYRYISNGENSFTGAQSKVTHALQDDQFRLVNYLLRNNFFTRKFGLIHHPNRFNQFCIFCYCVIFVSCGINSLVHGSGTEGFWTLYFNLCIIPHLCGLFLLICWRYGIVIENYVKPWFSKYTQRKFIAVAYLSGIVSFIVVTITLICLTKIERQNKILTSFLAVPLSTLAFVYVTTIVEPFKKKRELQKLFKIYLNKTPLMSQNSRDSGLSNSDHGLVASNSDHGSVASNSSNHSHNDKRNNGDQGHINKKKNHKHEKYSRIMGRLTKDLKVNLIIRVLSIIIIILTLVSISIMILQSHMRQVSFLPEFLFWTDCLILILFIVIKYNEHFPRMSKRVFLITTLVLFFLLLIFGVFITDIKKENPKSEDIHGDYFICNLLNDQDVDLFQLTALSRAAFVVETHQFEVLLDKAFGTKWRDWELHQGNEFSKWFSLYDQEANIWYVATAGTQKERFVSVIMDLYYWSTVASFQMSDFFYPYLKWSNPSAIIRIISFLSKSVEMFYPYMNSFYSETLQETDRIISTVDPDNPPLILLTGHSLGGGISEIVASSYTLELLKPKNLQNKLKAIIFNSPGIYYSRKKFTFQNKKNEIFFQNINRNVIDVKVESDPVGYVDKHAGMVQLVSCLEVDSVKCHNVNNTILTLWNGCGHKGKPNWFD